MKNIKDFAKKPQLIQVTIDNPEIVEAYGEPIDFWMMDYVDLSTYFGFFKAQGDNDGDSVNILLRKIILNQEGKPALADDEALPVDITVAALTKINEILGKLKTKQ